MGNTIGKNAEILPTTVGAFVHAQTPVKYNVYFTFREQINVKTPSVDYQNISDCIKIGDKIVFTDYKNKRLIICTSIDSVIHHNLPYKPSNITYLESNTVVVSCTADKSLLVIGISTGSVINTIKTSDDCYGTSFKDYKLYVIIKQSILHVMNMTGDVLHTVPLPSNSIRTIKVDKDRFVCIDDKLLYCCSLDGQLMWKFGKEKYIFFSRVTIDGEDNVYVTDFNTNTVVKVSDNGTHHSEILSELSILDAPRGIYFDKKENILLVCNSFDGKAFLFDVKRYQVNEHE